MDEARINKGKLETKPAGETDLSLLKLPLELIFTQLVCTGEEEERVELSFVL